MSKTSIINLRVTLNGTKPPIWRRLAVESDITLGQLHEAIQIVMGWTNSHMHQFILRDKGPKPKLRELPEPTGQSKREEIILPDGRRGIVLTNIPASNSPEATPAKPIAPIPTCRDRYFVTKVTPWGDDTGMEGEDEDVVTLAKVCPKVKSNLIYEYDFGDGWEHVIEVQKIVEPEDGVEYPVCLAGKKACPPEDCSGVWGYYELLEVIADHEHEQREEMLEWLGGEFDPDAFDLEEVNAILARWRGRD